ncbi:MAG TPA: hypothetical protein VEB68_02005 [Croceibacterium sp.]|nr:hypothetical protein [Croceibacterium sp.]
MIEAKTRAAAPLADRLAAKAGLLGEARAEALIRAHRRDPRRWRLAGLLWPLFAKDR